MNATETFNNELIPAGNQVIKYEEAFLIRFGFGDQLVAGIERYGRSRLPMIAAVSRGKEARINYLYYSKWFARRAGRCRRHRQDRRYQKHKDLPKTFHALRIGYTSFLLAVYS